MLGAAVRDNLILISGLRKKSVDGSVKNLVPVVACVADAPANAPTWTVTLPLVLDWRAWHFDFETRNAYPRVSAAVQYQEILRAH